MHFFRDVLAVAHAQKQIAAGQVHVFREAQILDDYLAGAPAAARVPRGPGCHPKGTLVVRKAGGDPLEYIKIIMEQIVVTSVQTGGSGADDRLTENVSLSFAQVRYEYTQQLATGGAGGKPKMGWDIAANRKLLEERARARCLSRPAGGNAPAGNPAHFLMAAARQPFQACLPQVAEPRDVGRRFHRVKENPALRSGPNEIRSHHRATHSGAQVT
jgi:type VI secretion system secreted protein Hcp